MRSLWLVTSVNGGDEHPFRAYLGSLLSRMRRRVVLAVVLTVIGGLAEAASIAVLVVVLQVIGLQPGSDGIGEVAAGVVRLLSAMGLEPSLGPVLATYIVIGLLLALVRRAQSVNTARLCLSYAAHLRSELYRSIADSSWLEISRARSSDLVHALTSEVDRVTAGTQQLVALTSAAVVSVVFLAFALQVSPIATAFAVLSGASVLVVVRWRATLAGRVGGDITKATASLYAGVLEHIAGIKTAKSHGAERASADLLAQKAGDVAESQIAAARAVADLKLCQEASLIAVAATVLGVAVGVGDLEPGGVILLLLLFMRIAPRLSAMQHSWSQLVQMLPAFGSVTDLRAHFQATAEAEPATDEVPVLGREITVEAVSFSYLPGRAGAIVDVDLVIPAGGTTAVVGQSGSGKTTLVDVVCGLLAPTAGRVLLDDRPLEAGLVRAWRSQVGYVGQESFLLHESLRANVQWGRPTATDSDVWNALEQASAAEFVAALPEGLDTLVGDRGVRLSGGERQRVALARALLRRPSLLVLDEATSNLDSENEARIQDAIDDLHGAVTILVVAHRLHTVRNADVICVLEQGRMVARGTWDQLASDADGRFAGLLFAQRLDGAGGQ